MDSLQKSLKSGMKLFDEALNASLPDAAGGKAPRLGPEDRERILNMLPPPHRQAGAGSRQHLSFFHPYLCIFMLFRCLTVFKSRLPM